MESPQLFEPASDYLWHRCCRLCKKSGWDNPDALISHAIKEHQVLKKPFPCYNCRLTGFSRKHGLIIHQKCGSCPGINWEKSWNQGVRIPVKEDTFQFTGSRSKVPYEFTSSTVSRKRPLSNIDQISPPTKHLKSEKVTRVESPSSVSLEPNNHQDSLTTSTTSKSTMSSTGRRSLLDWDSFINLPKKTRSLFLKRRNSSPARESQTTATSSHPELNAVVKEDRAQSSIKQSQTTSSPVELWGSLKVTELPVDSMVEVVPKIDPDFAKLTKKHPKAIAGSTVLLRNADDPILTGHGVVRPLGLKTFPKESEAQLIRTNSQTTSNVTPAHSPAQRLRRSDRGVERLSTSASKKVKDSFSEASDTVSRDDSFTDIHILESPLLPVPVFNSPTDDHIIISKSALRPRKSASSPSVTACPHCSRTVFQPHGLERHLRSCKGVSSDDKKNEIAVSPDGRPLQSTSDCSTKSSRFWCPHCNRTFLNAAGMVIHVRTCKQNKNYVLNGDVKPSEKIKESPSTPIRNSSDLHKCSKQSQLEHSGNNERDSISSTLKLTTSSKPEDQFVEKPPAPLTRLRSRLSMPYPMHTSQTAVRHSLPEYSCDPQDQFPHLRLRIRISQKGRSDTQASSRRDSLSSEGTLPPPLLPPATRSGKKRRSSVLSRASADSLASSVDEQQSILSDATTMPAVQDVRPSSRNSVITRSLSCSWCRQSNFASVRLLSLHLTKCSMRPRTLIAHSRSPTFTQIATRNKPGLSLRLWHCGSCGLKFRSRAVLRAHTASGCQRGRKSEVVSESCTGQLSCPGCPKAAPCFDSTEAVLTHLLSLKPGAGHPYANHGLMSTAQQWPAFLSIPNLGFGCHICGLLLASESRLDKHKRAMHEAWLQNEHQKALSPQKRNSSA